MKTPLLILFAAISVSYGAPTPSPDFFTQDGLIKAGSTAGGALAGAGIGATACLTSVAGAPLAPLCALGGAVVGGTLGNHGGKALSEKITGTPHIDNTASRIDSVKEGVIEGVGLATGLGAASKVGSKLAKPAVEIAAGAITKGTIRGAEKVAGDLANNQGRDESSQSPGKPAGPK
ncbi:uncharacterized protein VTP21DRAFT_8795 [Calcarisporiella thermophila]|uniref:uncharacterized protein n=1 Tax=Calcarisporiella thermophila TaxID=911321 RepID=UPI003744A966